MQLLLKCMVLLLQLSLLLLLFLVGVVSKYMREFNANLILAGRNSNRALGGGG